ncbi:MAG: ABC transporter permease subunit [Peptococcaceae bacterium]|nr:ABC transporter permease subunit [Peptococcaceae bacterium]
MRSDRQYALITKWLLISFFAVIVLFPLLRMLFKIAESETNIVKIMSSVNFHNALMNSLTISLTATLISVALASLLSWCVLRSHIRFKVLLTILFTLPMLIPSFSHGIGLIILFGKNGVISNVITDLLQIDVSIYGFWGIVIGSVMYSFPVAFLMVSDILRYEDSSPYEAAGVLGVPKIRQLTGISLPYLRKPMIIVAFAVFTMIITDYGVPMFVGDTHSLTLPVMMYQEVIGQGDLGKGSVIALVLLMPAVMAFVIDLLNKDRGNLSFVIKPFETAKNTLRDLFSYTFCGAVALLVLLPIGAFIVLTFLRHYPYDMAFTLENIAKTFDKGAGIYLKNSVMISLFVGGVGVVVASVTSYFTARMRGVTSKILHLISITTLAIPGLVLGLSYAIFFSPTFLYHTIAILIMVNLAHFIASPYLMMYNTFNKLNENLEDVGATLGISRIRIFLNVLLPQAKGTIAEMFMYLFVNSMMTISAVTFLYTSETKPISIMITSFEKDMNWEGAAFVSLMILAVNIVMKIGIALVKRRLLGSEKCV